MAAQTNSRYHVLPTHADDDLVSSAHDQLLTNTIALPHIPRSFSFTINPTVVLRAISTILALIAFIILVIDGGDAFIAADIFLMMIIIVNVLTLIHHTVTQLVKVTVEVRQTSYSYGEAQKLKSTMYFDLGFAVILILCLIIGNAVHDRWGGAWRAAVVIGYFVVFIQLVLAIPGLETKSLTISFKINDVDGKYVPDKLPTQASVLSGTDTVAGQRGTPEPQRPTLTPDSLV